MLHLSNRGQVILGVVQWLPRVLQVSCGAYIPQRRQARCLLGGDLRRPLQVPSVARELLLELGLHGGHRSGEVVTLLGIAGHVVELGSGPFDVVPLLVDQRPEIAPAEVDPGKERLAENLS